MTKNDKKLFEISCKHHLIEIVKNSETINKKLTFEQKILLFDKIKEMSLHEIVKLFFKEDSREIETSDERDVKYGASMTAGGLAARKLRGLKSGKLFKGKKLTKSTLVGAAVGLGLMFLYRRASDPCFKETIRILNPRKRQIAKLRCKNDGISKVISKIRSSISDCSGAPNPEKCKDKISFELNKWRSKYQENLVQLTKLSSIKDDE